MLSRYWCRLVPLVLVLGFAPTVLRAQSSFDAVYFAQPNNKIFKVTRFDPNGPGQAVKVILQNGTNFHGILVRQDGLILAANDNENILICDPASGLCANVINARDPQAMDIATATGSLVAVYDKVRMLKVEATGCLQTFQSPGCRPGGYQLNVATAKVSGFQLVDVKFAKLQTASWNPGDIALLSQKPAKLLKLSTFGGSPVTVISQFKFQGRLQTPTGLAFTSKGDALISTREGLILLYPGGSGSPELFANLGGAGARITVGVQGNGLDKRVFATVKSGQVQCYEEDDRTSCGKVTGLMSPDGIGIATGAFQVTQAPASGGAVSQTLALGLRTEWEEIFEDGVSVALSRQIADPREVGPNFLNSDFHFVDLYLCKPGPDCPAPDSATFVDLGIPSAIPANVRAFRPGAGPLGPFTGPPTFQVLVMTTTAGFRGIIQDHVGTPVTLNDDVNTWIGYDFHQLCPAPGVYYSPGPNDAEIVESPFFTDVTLACNHPLGGSWSRSTLLAGAYTTASPCQEAAYKLGNLEETFADAVFPADAGPSCDVGTPTPGGTPAGADRAAMEASIGTSLNDWALLDPSKGIFGGGSSGNGFLVNGVTVVVKDKNAGLNHELGTATASHGILPPPIVPNSDGQIGNSFPLPSSSSPYTFYFQNITGSPLTPIFSDESFSGVLGIAVYQNQADPTLFALFYDDGGGAPDKDFNDFVVTAKGPLGTKCSLELALRQARRSFDAACGPGHALDTIESLQSFVDAIDGAPASHLPSDNMDAQLRARALSLIFVLDKKVDP